MKIKYLICASAVLNDRFTNGVSIINIIDNVAPPSFPFWIPQVFCVGTVVRTADDPTNVSGKLTIHSANQVVAEAPVEMNFDGGVLAHGILLGFQGVRVDAVGELEFRLELPGLAAFSYAIDVLSPGAFPTLIPPDESIRKAANKIRETSASPAASAT